MCLCALSPPWLLRVLNGTLSIQIDISEKQFLALFHGVLWRGYGVTYDARMRENFKVISSLVCLVSKEVNLVKVAALQVLEAVRLIPAIWKHIERDLSSDGKCEAKLFANVMREHLRHGRGYGRQRALKEIAKVLCGHSCCTP